MGRNWSDGLEPRTKCTVEQIAVKYDAAWRSGWLSEDMGWKSPYCEGMIEAAGQMADEADEDGIRNAVAGYCAAHGYMLQVEQMPTWMYWRMGIWREIWRREDEERASKRTGVAESRRKLHKRLADEGFVVQAGPKPNSQWVLVNDDALIDGNPQTLFLEIHAHRDGREADYRICNSNWLPLQ